MTSSHDRIEVIKIDIKIWYELDIQFISMAQKLKIKPALKSQWFFKSFWSKLKINDSSLTNGKSSVHLGKWDSQIKLKALSDDIHFWQAFEMQRLNAYF